MAKTAKEKKTDEKPKPWDGKTVREVPCHKCGGMVNGNGCDQKDCPVRS